MIFDWDDDGKLSTDVDDVNKANKRRKKLGLKSIQAATETHRKEVIKAGGEPPQDIAKHRQQTFEWAV